MKRRKLQELCAGQAGLPQLFLAKNCRPFENRGAISGREAFYFGGKFLPGSVI
jgi:hypothetical protein